MSIYHDELLIISKVEPTLYKQAKDLALHKVVMLKKAGTLPLGYKLPYVDKEERGCIDEVYVEKVKGKIEVNKLEAIRDLLKIYRVVPMRIAESELRLSRFEIISELRELMDMGEIEIINEKTGERVKL